MRITSRRNPMLQEQSSLFTLILFRLALGTAEHYYSTQALWNEVVEQPLDFVESRNIVKLYPYVERAA